MIGSYLDKQQAMDCLSTLRLHNTCATCLFFAALERPTFNNNAVGFAYDGWCKRYPPTLLDPESCDPSKPHTQPLVSWYDWCGERVEPTHEIELSEIYWPDE